MPRSKYDKNVAPKWKPVKALGDRKQGMMWTDRIWHWLVSMGGLLIAACGVLILAYLHVRIAGAIIGIGLAIFICGFPNQAQRNGYRE